MNYKKIYDQLIERAKMRTLEGYSENHHIIPKCIGGSNELDNFVALTGREHFIAHLLLAKIYGGPLVHALWMMSITGKYNSIHYEWARKQHADRVSVLFKGRSGKYGEENGMYGRTHNEEARKNISAANKVKIICPHCSKAGGVAIMQRWHFHNCKLSPTYVKPQKMKRRSPTEETRNKISIAHKTNYENGYTCFHKGKKQKRGVVCPHCNKEGGAGQMSRWHFDNCKSLKSEKSDPTTN